MVSSRIATTLTHTAPNRRSYTAGSLSTSRTGRLPRAVRVAASGVRATNRPCRELGCGEPVHRLGRCALHAARVDAHQRQTTPTKRTRTYAEQKRRAQAVAAHRAQFGDWCPGYRVEPHAASDLTADHVVSVAANGNGSGELRVLCRSCNSRKNSN